MPGIAKAVGHKAWLKAPQLSLTSQGPKSRRHPKSHRCQIELGRPRAIHSWLEAIYYVSVLILPRHRLRAQRTNVPRTSTPPMRLAIMLHPTVRLHAQKVNSPWLQANTGDSPQLSPDADSIFGALPWLKATELDTTGPLQRTVHQTALVPREAWLWGQFEWPWHLEGIRRGLDDQVTKFDPMIMPQPIPQKRTVSSTVVGKPPLHVHIELIPIPWQGHHNGQRRHQVRGSKPWHEQRMESALVVHDAWLEATTAAAVPTMNSLGSPRQRK